MAIEVTCEGCGNTLTVDDSMAGKRGKCPSCKTVLVVPEEDAYEVEASEAEDEDVAGNACPNCGNELAEGDVFCIGCGTNLQTGKRMKGL